MIQEPTTETIQEYEGKYVPDVICANPNCGKFIALPIDTYPWYDEEVNCKHCHCVSHVKIGDWQDAGLGRVPSTTHFDNISRGGKLLEKPTLVRLANSVPPELTQGIGSNVPQTVRGVFDTAIDNFNGQKYDETAARCRGTLEAAFMDRGISRNSFLTRMASEARGRGLISQNDETICMLIASWGEMVPTHRVVQRNR